MNIFNLLGSLLAGYKTYLAALGLFGLALYDFSTGDYATAWQSLMAAIAAFGIKASLDRNEHAAVTRHETFMLQFRRHFNVDENGLENK